ncbi:hypothetical protein NGM10_13405 [Halorussus salilacus]|uniref:hypothetical protein n=1 Tax=Halorussus salilacus TaxID=2953750 RepID=UPI0020A0C60D|nr:hypothetical protein [Halorussus salilacus]USZ67718.1 hypothetical protein NGM10_13405 [Halorussus salilacus]
MKSGLALKQLSRRLHGTGGQTALVRGATAPPKPPDTVTVEPGVVASLGVDRPEGSLYVTAATEGGRAVRRYDGADARAAADCAAGLIDERRPSAVWLCAREQITSWWSVGVVDLLERRLSAAAREADAPLVVWSAESDGAVDDRYDVVLDP